MTTIDNHDIQMMDKELDELSGSISTIAWWAHQIALKKGWWDKERGVPETLMMVNSELCEALEAMRDEDNWGGFGREMADAVIRIFDACEFWGVDIGKEVALKMKVNARREYRHGDKRF